MSISRVRWPSGAACIALHRDGPTAARRSLDRGRDLLLGWQALPEGSLTHELRATRAELETHSSDGRRP